MASVNPLVGPLLTDMYQITMVYGYWKAGRHEEHAVFELFFRKNPFHGEFTIFAGLGEVLAFIESFHFSDSDIQYLREILPTCDPEFFVYLSSLNCSKLKVFAIKEGSIVFPREPLLRIDGPLAIAQLIETTLLNLVNYPSLVATNAARMRLAAGINKILLEFGLRRAQGPDGAVSASKYSYIGGCDGSSNVLAGKLFGIIVKGTHAHSFVQSYCSLQDINDPTLDNQNFVENVLHYRSELGWTQTNEGELAAFIAYAQAFPNSFLALIDTYDTLISGLKNFIVVALALDDLGHHPIGIRLDSGDLAYLSKETRKLFITISQKYNRPNFQNLNIVASNDINEDVLISLQKQGHMIDTFGIGTNLVTCQAQPALGCVYKLVELNGIPRIKLSQEASKVTIPGAKQIYRLIGSSGVSLIDVMTREDEPSPTPQRKFLCRHPFEENKRVYVTPSEVVPLLQLFWDGPNGGLTSTLPTIHEIRDFVTVELGRIREDILRFLNPTPYKVSLSTNLYDFLHTLWEKEVPVAELS